jgi:hypothetical protein
MHDDSIAPEVLHHLDKYKHFSIWQFIHHYVHAQLLITVFVVDMVHKLDIFGCI